MYQGQTTSGSNFHLTLRNNYVPYVNYLLRINTLFFLFVNTVIMYALQLLALPVRKTKSLIIKLFRTKEYSYCLIMESIFIALFHICAQIGLTFVITLTDHELLLILSQLPRNNTTRKLTVQLSVRHSVTTILTISLTI